MGELIINERVRSQMEQLDDLKRQSASLYERIEEMLTHEGPNLESMYTKLIGELLFEEFRLKTEVSRVSLTIELIQAYINRNVDINFVAVEKEVDRAFEEYQKVLDSHMEAIKAANEHLSSPVMKPEEAKELSSSYRLIAKKLHPDINPDATEEDEELFMKAVIAYKSGDLASIRAIVLMLETDVYKEIPAETLESQIFKLNNTVEDFKNRIEQLESSFPFNIKDKILDRDWTESEQRRLNLSIDSLKTTLQEKQQYATALKLWRPESLS